MTNIYNPNNNITTCSAGVPSLAEGQGGGMEGRCRPLLRSWRSHCRCWSWNWKGTSGVLLLDSSFQMFWLCHELMSYMYFEHRVLLCHDFCANSWLNYLMTFILLKTGNAVEKRANFYQISHIPLTCPMSHSYKRQVQHCTQLKP